MKLIKKIATALSVNWLPGVSDLCIDLAPGQKRAYYISCRSYWQCYNGIPRAACCPDGQRFNSLLNVCEKDVEGICNVPCPPMKSQVILSESQSSVDVSKFSWFTQRLICLCVFFCIRVFHMLTQLPICFRYSIDASNAPSSNILCSFALTDSSLLVSTTCLTVQHTK